MPVTIESAQPDSLNQLAADLDLHAVEVSPSQVQGIACGLVCANTAMSTLTWPRLVMADDAVHQELPVALARTLANLTEHVRRRLDSTDFEFALLLPDDSESTDTRATALGEWCQGFSLGLFADGVHEPHTLPGDAREIVRDIIEIAGAEIDTGEDDPDTVTDDVEASLMEIEEYLRVGAQLVYEELREAREGGVSNAGANTIADEDAGNHTDSSELPGDPSTIH